MAVPLRVKAHAEASSPTKDLTSPYLLACSFTPTHRLLPRQPPSHQPAGEKSAQTRRQQPAARPSFPLDTSRASQAFLSSSSSPFHLLPRPLHLPQTPSLQEREPQDQKHATRHNRKNPNGTRQKRKGLLQHSFPVILLCFLKKPACGARSPRDATHCIDKRGFSKKKPSLHCLIEDSAERVRKIVSLQKFSRETRSRFWKTGGQNLHCSRRQRQVRPLRRPWQGLPWNRLSSLSRRAVVRVHSGARQ